MWLRVKFWNKKNENFLYYTPNETLMSYCYLDMRSILFSTDQILLHPWSTPHDIFTLLNMGTKGVEHGLFLYPKSNPKLYLVIMWLNVKNWNKKEIILYPQPNPYEFLLCTYRIQFMLLLSVSTIPLNNPTWDFTMLNMGTKMVERGLLLYPNSTPNAIS